jgi:hypothetical protein
MSQEFDQARRAYRAAPNADNKLRLILIAKRLGVLTDRSLRFCHELGDEACSKIYNPKGWSKTPEMPTSILEWMRPEGIMLMFLQFAKDHLKNIKEEDLEPSLEIQRDLLDYEEGEAPDLFYSERFDREFKTNKDLIQLVIDDIVSSLQGGEDPIEQSRLNWTFDNYFGNLEGVLYNLCELERVRKEYPNSFGGAAADFLLGYTDPREKLINYFLDRHL